MRGRGKAIRHRCVASDCDLPAHKADFGQTLGVWCVESGPSVQLPLLGPSNLRDAAGTAVGLLCNPVGYVPRMQVVQTAGAVGGAIDGRGYRRIIRSPSANDRMLQSDGA